MMWVNETATFFYFILLETATLNTFIVAATCPIVRVLAYVCYLNV